MRQFTMTVSARSTWRWVQTGCVLSMILAIHLLAACTVKGTGLGPVEEEQIKNVVTKYYVRDSRVPQQDVEIQKVYGHWARVSIKPVGVKTDMPDLFFLQDQATATNDAPVAKTTVQPGKQVSVTTTSGWAIILGPKARFTQVELDAVGVPPQLRP